MNRLPSESAQIKTKMLPLSKMAVSHTQMRFYAAEVKNTYLQLKTQSLSKDEASGPSTSVVVPAIRKSKEIAPEKVEKKSDESLPSLEIPMQPDFWLPVTVLIPAMPHIVQNETGKWIPSTDKSNFKEYLTTSKLITDLQKLPGPVERLQLLVEHGLAKKRELTLEEEKLLKLEIVASDVEEEDNMPQHCYWRTLQRIFPHQIPNLIFNPDNKIKWDLPKQEDLNRDARLANFYKLAICNNYENTNVFLGALKRNGYIDEQQRSRYRNPYFEDTPFRREMYYERFKGEVVSLKKPSIKKKSILKSEEKEQTAALNQAVAMKTKRKLRFNLAPEIYELREHSESEKSE